MVALQDIQATCDDIVREFAPIQVILFGSYAYGTPTEDSDVDLLVVMPIPKSETRRQEVEIQQRIPRRFRLDVLVRDPEEIAYRVLHNDWFLREILEKGDVLYGTDSLFEKVLETTNKLRHKNIMNPLTLEWVRKAEADYTTIKLLQQALTPDLYDTICFHAQQCIEKYLKAWLQEANLPVPRMHNLKELLDLIVATLPAWRAWEADFSEFDKYAVDARYPGYFATAVDAQQAVQICTEVRQAVRATLELPIP